MGLYIRRIRRWFAGRNDKSSENALRAPLLLLLCLILLITGGSYFIFERLQRNETHRVQQNLAAIANLKTEQITGWLNQNNTNAVVLSNNSALANRIAEWLAKGAPPGQGATWLQGRIKQIREQYSLGELAILDMNGDPRMTTDSRFSDMTGEQELLRRAINSRQPVWGELRWDTRSEGNPYVSLPIAAPLITSNGQVKGILWIELDAHQFLFPVIQNWPVRTETAETLLVRRERDSVLFLNELRNQQNTALRLRVPIDHPTRISAQALRGNLGLITGIDYRNVPAIGYAVQIPDTDWVMVAKIDEHEVYAPISRMRWIVITSSIFLLLVSSLMLYLWWRQRLARHQAEKLQAELNRRFLAERYQYVSKFANDIILLLDRNHTIVDANDRAESAFGFPLSQLIGMDLLELRNPRDKNQINERWEQILREKSLVFESEQVKSDGTVLPVEISARVIEKGGDIFVQSILRDITERKRAREREQRLTNMYRIIAAMDHAIVRLASESALFSLTCRLAVEYGGLMLAWIGIPDKSGRVMPVASHGKPHQYLDEVVISTKIEEPEGQGPIGKAWRSQQAIVAHDFANDESSRPWAEKVKQYGLRSASSFPLIRSGEPYAVFTVYSEDTLTFDEEIVMLLQNMTDNLSFALDNLDRERQRQRHEEEVRAIFEKASDGIFVANRHGRYIDVNERGAEMLGYNMDEVRHLGVLDVVSEHDRTRLPEETANWSLVAPELSEWQFVRKDGSTFIGEVSIKILPDERIISMVRDVTERKRIENALRESELRFRIGLSNAKVAVFEHDRELRYTWLNYSLVGDNPVQIIGKHDADLMDADSASELERVKRSVLETGNSAHHELCITTTEGEIRCFHLYIEPKRNAAGQTIGLVGASVDTTEVKLNARRLERFSELLQASQATARVGAWELNLKNQALYWTEESYRIMEITDEQFTPTLEALFRSFTPESAQAMQQALQNSAERKIPFDIEAQVFTAKGRHMWARITGKTVEEDGKPVRTIGAFQDITERKEAELALRESEERYRTLFDNSPDGIFLTAADGRVFQSNPSACAMLGMSEAEITARGRAGIVEDAPSVRAALRERERTGRAVQVEMVFRRKDGTGFPVEVSSAIFGKGMAIVIARDITRRKKAEDALRESEFQFRQLADAMPQLVWAANPDGNVDYFNRRLDEYAEVTRKDNGEYEWANMIYPDDLGATAREWQESLRTGKPFQVEHRLLRADGSYRWYINRGVPIRNVRGSIVKWYGSATDVHDLKLAQERATRNEERLRLAQQVTRIGTFDWDIRQNTVDWSPEEEALYGFMPGEFGGTYQDWVDRLHPEDRGRAQQEIEECMGPGHYESDFRVIWPDGSVRWIVARGRVFKDESDQPLRMIGVNIDITERKRAEEEHTAYLRQFETVLENLSEGVVIFDGTGHVTSVNPSALRINDLTGVESAMRHMTEFEPDFELSDSTNRVLPLSEWPITRVLKGKHFSELELCVHNKKTGKKAYVAYSGSPITDDRNTVYLGVLTLRDVTERKKIEEELRMAALVFHESAEAMIVTDAADRIISVNPAFERMTGFALPEMAGKNPAILSSDKDTLTHYSDMLDKLARNHYWQGELWLKRKNGENFAAAMTINTTFNPDGSVSRHVGLFTDVTERKLAEEKVWRQANFDALTGLPNRRHFIDELDREIRESRRSGLPVALLFLDLDGFKYVNDTLGHEAGDVLLKETGERLKRCVRETDTVARLGGDEFTIILGGLTNVRHAEKVARHILHKIVEPFVIGDEVAHVSASLGITFYPQDASSRDELLITADHAMYAAKESGKNRYSFFTEAMQKAAQDRIWLVNELRNALDSRQFKLVYQPIVELSNGCVNKAEALLRWDHPQRGLIEPAVFIPIAEETGMIQEIGNWVFYEAASQVAKWRKAYHPDFQISINKSPIQFKARESDVERWLGQLKHMELPGQAISVEITEGILMDESKAIKDQLLAFRDAGIEVSLDDFGTGYSSMSYLKRFDIDRLKIDQTFVRDLETNAEDQALCEAMIVMGHKLGIKVIAEGVETDRQREILANAGCDFVQGYLLSNPISADKLDDLLSKGARYCPGMPLHVSGDSGYPM